MPESRKQHRVFVVHDEFAIAGSLAAMLRLQGFDARWFTDPLEALSAAGSEAPEMLISSFAMSRLTGAELAKQMQAHNPDCKVLLFSAQGKNGSLGEDRGTEQRFQILTMLLHPKNLSRRVNAANEPAY